MHMITKQRPHTGIVCDRTEDGDRRIGRVTRQNRVRKDGVRQFFTATLEGPNGEPVGAASLGTRYPTQMCAARALWLFDRDYPAVAGSQDRALISAAVREYRERYGIVPGKLYDTPHVPA